MEEGGLKPSGVQSGVGGEQDAAATAGVRYDNQPQVNPGHKNIRIVIYRV